MMRYEIGLTISAVLLAFVAGFQVAQIQVRQAQIGWKRAMDDNNRLIDMVKTTTGNLEKTVTNLNAQNQAVEQLLAEKRAAWGMLPEKSP